MVIIPPPVPACHSIIPATTVKPRPQKQQTPTKQQQIDGDEDYEIHHDIDDHGDDSIGVKETSPNPSRPTAPPTTAATTAATTAPCTISYRTAVAIIPPDDAWEKLQQARHWVQDPTVHIWPPAIRLFHPFVDPGQSLLDDNVDDDAYAGEADYNHDDDGNNYDAAAVVDPDAALYDDLIFCLAECIEQLNFTACQITLSEWSVIPHVEAMVGLFNNDPVVPSVTDHNNNDNNDNDNDDDTYVMDEETRQIRALIAREEAIGKINRANRKRQGSVAGRRSSGRPPRISTTTDDDESTKNRKTNDRRRRSSQSPKNTFDGNCVIVLEPDTASRNILVQLRAALLESIAKKVGHVPAFADLYSPTSTMKDNGVVDNTMAFGLDGGVSPRTPPMPPMSIYDEWRPVVPIAAVATTAAAIPLAKHLRASWPPITFNVTDLHIISRRRRRGTALGRNDEIRDRDEHGLDDPRLRRHRAGGGSGGNIMNSGDEAFGCDALISFVGEEPVELDDAVDEQMAYYVSDHGEAGGADTTDPARRPPPGLGGFSNGLYNNQSANPLMVVLDDYDEDYQRDDDDYAAVTADDYDNEDVVFMDDDFDGVNEDEVVLLEQDVVDDNAVHDVVDDEENYISPALEAWLNQDAADLDDADEGSVVVIGRVQFFTGHMRDYVGMPAVSALDTHTWYGTGHQLRTTKRQKRSLASLSSSSSSRPQED